MNTEIKRLPKNTVEIVFKVPWEEIKKTYDLMLDEVVSNAEISGFRKGKAPRDIVEKNLNKTSFFEEIIKKILPELYQKAIKENDIKPIIYPHIEIISAEETKEWVFKALICEAPVVDLGNYKDEVKGKAAKDKIWIPGKDNKPEEQKDKEKKLSDNLQTILSFVKIDIADVLLDDETNKLLSQLLDEIKKLGLTLEQYLASSHKTVELLRSEYQDKAMNSLKLEFILNQIADTEKISVSDEEIKKAISEVKDDRIKKDLENSSYQLASLLRRQKTLDFITELS